MKEENYFIRCLIFMMILLFSSFFLGVDSPSKQQRAGKFVDDPLITSKEKPQLGADDYLRSLEISVETQKENFRLHDLVDTRRIVDMADEIAKGVNGVKTVKNNLSVKK
jgi:osmotically-inducible protein OsmY